MANPINPRDQVQTAYLDRVLVEIDNMLGDALGEIMAHPEFTGMKSMWFGLHALCESAWAKPNIALETLNASKLDLIDDFDAYLDLADSALFYHLYKSEYDQAGGTPYTAVLFQESFANTAADIQLLRQFSMVAAACHCPVIANAGPGLFGIRDFAMLEQVRDFKLHFHGADYVKWKQLCSSPDSRYLALALPRVRVRFAAPRPPPHLSPPRYCQDLYPECETAWVHGGVAVGMVLIQSFHEHGWCVHIRGPKTGGLVSGIQGVDLGERGYDLREIPLEVAFSDRQEQELAAQGFLPLTYYRALERICIFSAPSLQDTAANGGDRIAASLPYLFLVSRIAHYQKSIQRENVGSVKEGSALEIELDRWLKTLITKMPDPTLEMRSRFPLRNGSVRVVEDNASPGFFTVQLVVQPHLQLEGVNAQLTLVSKMPRKE